jgi:hypothetical protein
MVREVDSFRGLDAITARVVKAWIAREPERTVPFHPLGKPLSEANVALLSSAAMVHKEDRPFDQEGERENPWWGDPSHRTIPTGTRTADIRIDHLHIDDRPALEDLNCVLPIERLVELKEAGEIGEVAPRHYSMMGYLLRPRVMLEETVPRMLASMREDGVDAVVLVPV